MKRIIVLGMVIVAVFSFFGCKKNNNHDLGKIDRSQKTMLIDYFERTVGTPMEMPYYEVVLYSYSESELVIEEYTDGGTSSETVTKYLVPEKAYADIMNVIDSRQMGSWNKRNDLSGITGKLYVCKFRSGEEYVRVTSESMPEDGIDSFYDVLRAMKAYMTKDSVMS